MKKHKIIKEFGWLHLRSHLKNEVRNDIVFEKIEEAQSGGPLSLWMRPEGLLLSDQLDSYRGMDYEEA